MDNNQFNHALALTRCRGKSAEAARLHLVAGLSITEAAQEVGITRQTVGRSVNSILNKIEGIKMTARKLGIFLAEDSLKFLKIIQNQHGDEDYLNLSTAVNLCIQLGKVISDEPLPLTKGELLLCCDVLNGGAHLTEFSEPSSVSINAALESMKFSLRDARLHENGIFEKWDVVESEFLRKLETLIKADLFTLAIATRQFWKGIEVEGKKPIKECSGYQTWAAQWVI